MVIVFLQPEWLFLRMDFDFWLLAIAVMSIAVVLISDGGLPV